eukprot:scaffold14937_cov18-Tisochrysis_lutea.AAC.1
MALSPVPAPAAAARAAAAVRAVRGVCLRGAGGMRVRAVGGCTRPPGGAPGSPCARNTRAGAKWKERCVPLEGAG